MIAMVTTATAAAPNSTGVSFSLVTHPSSHAGGALDPMT